MRTDHDKSERDRFQLNLMRPGALFESGVENSMWRIREVTEEEVLLVCVVGSNPCLAKLGYAQYREGDELRLAKERVLRTMVCELPSRAYHLREVYASMRAA